MDRIQYIIGVKRRAWLLGRGLPGLMSHFGLSELAHAWNTFHISYQAGGGLHPQWMKMAVWIGVHG
jgi:hypothetical protein